MAFNGTLGCREIVSVCDWSALSMAFAVDVGALALEGGIDARFTQRDSDPDLSSDWLKSSSRLPPGLV